MEEAPTASKATASATNGLAPRHIIRRNTRMPASEITRPANSTTAFKPADRNKAANTTSESHSHANQVSPAFENENRSVTGTCRCSRMYSPVRMCQPVSPSTRRPSQPSLPAANIQMRIERNRKSQKDGSSRRCHRCGRFTFAPPRPGGPGSSTEAADGGAGSPGNPAGESVAHALFRDSAGDSGI